MAALSSPSAFPPSTTAPHTGGGSAGHAPDTEPGGEGDVATTAGIGAEADGAGLRAAANDRGFDFSLRVLTVLVLVGLLGSVSLLGYRWIAPRFEEPGGARATSRPEAPRPAPPPASAGRAPGDEILMDPHKVFRCEEQGRVSFSDHACTGGAAQGPAQAPAAGAGH